MKDNYQYAHIKSIPTYWGVGRQGFDQATSFETLVLGGLECWSHQELTITVYPGKLGTANDFLIYTF